MDRTEGIEAVNRALEAIDKSITESKGKFHVVMPVNFLYLHKKISYLIIEFHILQNFLRGIIVFFTKKDNFFDITFVT